MEKREVASEDLAAFREYLIREEKSGATVEKYLRDAETFVRFLAGRPAEKERLIEYKAHLEERRYEVASINSMLTAVNRFVTFLGLTGCRVRTLKLQRAAYTKEERELTRDDYERLVTAARSHPRLCLLIQTICATGIRVSELRYFTVEALRRGEVVITCKGKTRVVLLPAILIRKLLVYAAKNGIKNGAVFRTRNGNPMNRSHIWAEMKGLAKAACVPASRIFPHNLRKLFARAFYRAERDIAKLADVLGHSSINTTRLYIMTTGTEHRKIIEQLGFVV